MDTDSKPLSIDYTPKDSDPPLHISLADPNDNGYIVRVSDTRWHYWPGYVRAIPVANTGSRTADPQLAGAKVRLIDICAGDFYSRVQVWPTQYLPNIAKRYPNPNRSPLPHTYDTPINFIQVPTLAIATRQLSPRFTVQQFLPPGISSNPKAQWPQPLLVRMPLLEKLESVLSALAEHGKPAATLTILSGYRTPHHNRRVGGATYSRHMYGDAADFIVDTDNDGKMDDLNGDGKVSRADLRWLLDRLASRPVPVTAGGTGAYESHGQAEAFLHIDARGRAYYWQ